MATLIITKGRITVSYSRKKKAVRFSNFSKGLNTSKDSTVIGNQQVQESKNAILRENGADRRPGTIAKENFNLTDLIKGLHNYLDFVNIEHLLMGSGGKLYDVAKADGAPTLRYDLGGTDNFYFADALGRCFIVNGNEVVKDEGGTTYQVGIDAPTGASAGVIAGGSLAEGTYGVYAGYGREEGGVIVLYSTGQYLGTVNLTAGNQTVQVTNFAQSSDPQVDKRVIWMTDADLSTVYRYYTADNDATATHNVTSDADKSESILYSVDAVDNISVPDFEHILAADNRLWGSVDNVLYYSLMNSANPYDLERFFTLNRITLKYKITGLFEVQGNVYMNTPYGIFMQSNADVTARTIHVEKRWYFKYMNTVVDYNGGKLGLTNDGVKFFDGEKFLDYDISEDVKAEITKMYSTVSGFEPFAVIIRRDIRTEYHISYNDNSFTAATNNKRIVLNLDKLAYLPEKQVTAPWEIWDNGATHMTTDLSGITYQAQSHATAPKLYVENPNTTIDNGIYLQSGAVGTEASYIELLVCTKTILLDMSSRLAWNLLRVMARLSAKATIEIHIRDVEGENSSDLVGAGDEVSLWDVFLWDVGTWASTTPRLIKTRLPASLKGYMMFVKFYQTANDPEFNIQDIVVEGTASQIRFT